MNDSTVKWLSRLHKTVFRASRGKVGKRLVDNDMLLLTTIGHRSGKPHTVPLLFLENGHGLVVIASYGGRDHNPHWYVNLVHDPRVQVEVPGLRTAMVARTANDEERRNWWPRVVEAYDGYESYQTKTQREIPVVFLEPV